MCDYELLFNRKSRVWEHWPLCISSVDRYRTNEKKKKEIAGKIQMLVLRFSAILYVEFTVTFSANARNSRWIANMKVNFAGSIANVGGRREIWRNVLYFDSFHVRSSPVGTDGRTDEWTSENVPLLILPECSWFQYTSAPLSADLISTSNFIFCRARDQSTPNFLSETKTVLRCRERTLHFAAILHQKRFAFSFMYFTRR